MPNAKHTPGPWRWADGWTPDTFGSEDGEYSGEKYADLRLLGANGESVIPLRVDHHSVEMDAVKSIEMIRTADRNLIAAAPELLEALKRIAECQPRPSRDGRYDAHDVENMQRTARLAIARATGEGV